MLSKNTILCNMCGSRIKLGRALQNPPISQCELAQKINLMGYNITPLIISEIEKKSASCM